MVVTTGTGGSLTCPRSRVSPAARYRVELYKSKYAQLHEMLLSSYEKDCSMLEKAKTMRDALREVKLKLERARIEQDKEQKIVKDLEKERDKAEKELRDAEEQEITLHCNVNELAVRPGLGKRGGGLWDSLTGWHVPCTCACVRVLLVCLPWCSARKRRCSRI